MGFASFRLDIKEGEKIAILGRSGSGKSTLASLLRGDLKASQGEITLGGADVSIVGDCISNYIGVIQQAPYLFNTTLLNNIRIGNQDASEEDVWKVLERVGLKEMVTDLSEVSIQWLMKLDLGFQVAKGIELLWLESY